MNLEVKRDSIGILKEVNIYDVSSREWVLMKIALEKYLESEEAQIIHFEDMLNRKIERNDEEEIQSTQQLLEMIRVNISDLKNMLEKLTEKR